MTEEKKPLLLVVDDDDLMRDFVTHGLSSTYRIVSAQDGQQAKELYAQMGESINAVISDVDMPILDGVSLTSWLLGQPQPPPVILMSGGLSHTAEAARDLWANMPGISWLDKPFPMRKLRELVERKLTGMTK